MARVRIWAFNELEPSFKHVFIRTKLGVGPLCNSSYAGPLWETSGIEAVDSLPLCGTCRKVIGRINRDIRESEALNVE